MNDEQFEAVLDFIRRNWNSGGNPVADLRARDTAQREALARVEAELVEALGEIRIYQQKFRYIAEGGSFYLSTAAECVRLTSSFLAMHANTAQAEQQEAQDAQAGDERAAFERKVQDLAERLQPDYRRYGDAGEYKDATLEWAWNLWMARAALATRPAAGEPIHQWADQDLWMDGDEADMASARAEGFKTRTLWTVPPAAAHGDEAVAVVGTVPDGSGFKSLDFKVDLQDLPDGTRLYAKGAGGAST